MGYSDLNASVTVTLADSTEYLAEVQLSHSEMTAAKHAAHGHYEVPLPSRPSSLHPSLLLRLPPS